MVGAGFSDGEAPALLVEAVADAVGVTVGGFAVDLVPAADFAVTLFRDLAFGRRSVGRLLVTFDGDF